MRPDSDLTIKCFHLLSLAFIVFTHTSFKSDLDMDNDDNRCGNSTHGEDDIGR